jgi:hypothetical protein
MYAAEYVWFETLLGDPEALCPGDVRGKLPGNQLGEGGPRSIEELSERWGELEGRWREYLVALSEHTSGGRKDPLPGPPRKGEGEFRGAKGEGELMGAMGEGDLSGAAREGDSVRDAEGEASLNEMVERRGSAARGGRPYFIRRWDAILHMCLHAHYTLTQIVNMLRHLGVEHLPDRMLIQLTWQESE